MIFLKEDNSYIAEEIGKAIVNCIEIVIAKKK